jgi:hypothetical protein
MKVLNISTILALAALINASSAMWCDCWVDSWLIDPPVVDKSKRCCKAVMGTNLMKGHTFFFSPKDKCDVSGDKVEEFKECCKDRVNKFYGYCK